MVEQIRQRLSPINSAMRSSNKDASRSSNEDASRSNNECAIFEEDPISFPTVCGLAQPSHTFFSSVPIPQHCKEHSTIHKGGGRVDLRTLSEWGLQTLYLTQRSWYYQRSAPSEGRQLLSLPASWLKRRDQKM